MNAAELAEGLEGSQAAAEVVQRIRARGDCGAAEDCVHPVSCKECGSGLLYVTVLPARALIVFACAICPARVGLTLPAPQTAS